MNIEKGQVLRVKTWDQVKDNPGANRDTFDKLGGKRVIIHRVDGEFFYMLDEDGTVHITPVEDAWALEPISLREEAEAILEELRDE